MVATVGGIACVAAGSALYLGAHLGPGPRDGLMVAIAVRTGWPVGVARAALELTVLAIGVLLGGPVGVGPCSSRWASARPCRSPSGSCVRPPYDGLWSFRRDPFPSPYARAAC